MHPRPVGGHVDVDDVARLQRAIVGDAVTDHLVDRCADRLREPAVAERRRIGTPGDVRRMRDRIDVVGGDPWSDSCGRFDQDLGRDPTRFAQRGQRLGVVDLRSAGADTPTTDVRRPDDRVGHGTTRAHRADDDRRALQQAPIQMAPLQFAATTAEAGFVRSKTHAATSITTNITQRPIPTETA